MDTDYKLTDCHVEFAPDRLSVVVRCSYRPDGYQVSIPLEESYTLDTDPKGLSVYELCDRAILQHRSKHGDRRA